MKFLEAFANMFKIPDLRKRLLFTLGLLAVYRLGARIPTPGINVDRLTAFFQQNAGSLFGLFDIFSGGNSAGSPSSPWASCPTSRPPSFCNC